MEERKKERKKEKEEEEDYSLFLMYHLINGGCLITTKLNILLMG
jgi:hypothetical protein